MDQVPFEQVERVERTLMGHEPLTELLTGLVAVFSKVDCDDLLLVYTQDPPPPPRPAGSRAIPLEDLGGIDLLAYDGPVIGFTCIDVIRWDIPTKGSEFCRLDRLMRRHGHLETARANAALLATYLGNNLAEITSHSQDESLDRRARAEIAAMAAPQAIARLRPDQLGHMVAYLPRGCRAIDLDDLPWHGGETPVGPDETVIALAEVRELLLPRAGEPAGSSRYPLELRTVLRRSRLEGCLPDTLAALALAFHQRAGRTGGPGAIADLRRAYALALELHLGRGDVDDLCAVLIDADLETFLHTGRAAYLYRRPLDAPAGRSGDPHIRRLPLTAMDAGLAGRDWPITFSLLPLRRMLFSSGAATDGWSDLGPVLRKLDRAEVLARNAWLLARDFVEFPDDRVPLPELLETLTHCCAIFSLTDPWRARQGRRQQWIDQAYQTLDEVLGTLGEAATGIHRSYYGALRTWYRCARRDFDVGTALESIVATLREARSAVESEPGQDLIEQATSLEELATALVDVLHGGGRAEAYASHEELFKPTQDSVPQVVGQATAMERPLVVVSEPFRGSFQQYASLADAVRRHGASQVPVNDKIDQLRAGANQLRQAKRLIFADQHQVRILGRIYDRAIEDADRQADQLEQGASVEVELRTPTVTLDRDSRIVLGLTNVGRLAAHDVQVELQASEDFELLDRSFRKTVRRLPSEHTESVFFQVRWVAHREALPLRCVVSYAGTGEGAGQRRSEFTYGFSIRPSRSDGRPFEPKPNPYVFGVPLKEPRQFYGRREEVNSVLSHLAEARPQNILLRGARRAGKTSLLHMVREVLRDTAGGSGVRAYFDVPRTWHQGLDRAVPVMLNLQAIDWGPGGPTPTRFYRTVLGKLAEAGLHSDRADRLLTEPALTWAEFEPGLRAVLDNARGRRPVMLVDEFDIVSRVTDTSFYDHLRTLISDVQAVSWIVASAVGLYKEIRSYESPLFNVFKIVTLGGLQPDAARRLIRSPWRQEHGPPDTPRLLFEDAAVDAILTQTDRYPYFIQLLCSEIVGHVNAMRISVVRYETVFQVIEERLVGSGSAAYEHFAYLWDLADGIGKMILVALLRQPGLEPIDLRQTVLHELLAEPRPARTAVLEAYDESLQRLETVNAVRRVPGSGYEFGIPLFRRLLLERDTRQDLADVARSAVTAADPGAGPA